MFNAANQTHFSLSIEGASHDLQVLEFTGREAISQPFVFELELISERPDLDLESLLHHPAFLAISPSGPGIHGLISRIAQGDSGQRLPRSHAALRPQLTW